MLASVGALLMSASAAKQKIVKVYSYDEGDNELNRQNCKMDWHRRERRKWEGRDDKFDAPNRDDDDWHRHRDDRRGCGDDHFLPSLNDVHATDTGSMALEWCYSTASGGDSTQAWTNETHLTHAEYNDPQDSESTCTWLVPNYDSKLNPLFMELDTCKNQGPGGDVQYVTEAFVEYTLLEMFGNEKCEKAWHTHKLDSHVFGYCTKEDGCEDQDAENRYKGVVVGECNYLDAADCAHMCTHGERVKREGLEAACWENCNFDLGFFITDKPTETRVFPPHEHGIPRKWSFKLSPDRGGKWDYILETFEDRSCTKPIGQKVRFDGDKCVGHGKNALGVKKWGSNSDGTEPLLFDIAFQVDNF